MRRIALILLTAVFVVGAVEWDVEPITEAPDRFSFDPLLSLDEQGNARVVFQQFNGRAYLKVASNATGSWVIKDIPKPSNDYSPGYSLDVDPSRNTVVAFVEWTDPMGEYTDIFLATDSTGEFVSVNITDDELFQVAPVLKLNQEGIPHLLYAVLVTEEIGELYHGWVDAGGFHSEQVTENMYPWDFLGYDLVFDPLHIPHAFYIGDDSHLWQATSGEPAWIAEQLNELSSEWPSAVADPLGSFHVAYDVGGSSIHYITNMSGTWQDELVSDLGDPEGGNERPSLALEIVYGGYLGIGNPHVVWLRPDDLGWRSIWYASKETGGWTEELAIPSGFDQGAEPGYGRYFAIDSEGYGHLVYSMYDYGTGFDQILYAKSKEPLIGGITEHPAVADPLDLEIHGSTVRFSLPHSSLIRLDLYDAAGRRVTCIASGIYAAGEHSIPINQAELAAGVYFVHLEAADYTSSAKLVVIR